MPTRTKVSQIKAWTEEHSAYLSESAIDAAETHLTFAEAKEKGFITENDIESKYTVAREKHIEITLSYIKAKPKTLMKR